MLLFVLFFFAVRLPFLASSWDGTDGNGPHAAILMHHAPHYSLMLAARLDGHEVYVPGFRHPLLLYALLSLSGRFTRFFVDFDVLQGRELAVAIKGVGSFFLLSILCAMLAITLARARNRLPVIWLFLVCLAPIALYASAELQVDSSSGAFLVGCFFLALLALQKFRLPEVMGYGAVFCGSLLASMGKNDWTLVLGCSVLGSVFYFFLLQWLALRGKLSSWLPERTGGALLLSAGAGLIAGNIISYWLGPSDYLGGWELLRSMVRGHSLVGASSSWWQIARQRRPVVFFELVAMGLCLLGFFRKRRFPDMPTFLAGSFSFLLFLGYFLSTCGAASRAFAPSFVGFAATALMSGVFDEGRDLRGRQMVWVAFSLILLQSAHYYLRFVRFHADFTQPDFRPLIAEARSGCVPMADSASVLNDKEVDFMHNQWAWEDAVGFLRSHGKELCGHEKYNR